MSSKGSNTAPKVNSPADLRNVVLIGSSGSGKTTLFENLIKARIPGYRGEKDDPERAAALTLATITDQDVVINLLDAPGHSDYVGELRAGLRAADGAVFVVSAADGIDVTTRLLWQECKAAGMPLAVVVTKLDTERADYEAMVGQITDAFGNGVHPAYLPLQNASGEIIGNMSLLSRAVHDYSSGARVRRMSNPAEDELIDSYRTDYVEGIITESENDELLERYFEGEDLPVDEVVEDFLKAMYHGNFYPVLPVLTSGVGTEELIGLIRRGFPTPLRHTMPNPQTLSGETVEAPPTSPDAPLLAQVIRTTSDPYAGRLSMVRIFAGTLTPDTSIGIYGPGKAEDDRVGLLSAPNGFEMTPKEKAIAGEIVYVAKLANANTADTLTAKDKPLIIPPWPKNRPLLPVAVRASSRNDEDKLAGALQRLVLEDNAVIVERAEGTDQLLIWTMGQAHHDLLMNRLTSRYGVQVTAEPIKVALRETFIAPSKGLGRHVKQSGGHGQYAVCNIEVEPLPRGSGFEFVDKVVGGAVPRQFIPSVEKGVRQQLEKGTLTNYPVVDLRVTLYDGKAHSVDSSDMAFQSAGALALKEAAAAAGKIGILEPLDEVTVTITDDYLGGVMTDLSNRRGQLLGTDHTDDGKTVVKALVPQSELARYAVDLRGLTQGAGTFTRTFSAYELMPALAMQEVLKEK